MAGKRPDQYQIAPGEATRTDYKWTTDADPVDLQNQKASRARVRARGRQPIPPAVPEPTAERKASDRRARRARGKRGGRRGRASGTQEKREDRA